MPVVSLLFRAKSSFSVLAVCFLALIATGCQSKIQTYDSTFTSTINGLSGTSSQSFKSSSAYTGPIRAKSKRIRPAKLKKPYFIEFRARQALTYGHASVVFGLRDKNGKVPVDKKGVLIPGAVEISGLHPAGESTVPWSVGHIVPVPAETGPSDGDFEDEYVTARYRINLTEKQFRRVVRVVAKRKRSSKVWSGPLYACTHYIGGIARDLGLKGPGGLYLPKRYVEQLKARNGKNPRI